MGAESIATAKKEANVLSLTLDTGYSILDQRSFAAKSSI
jgi:hypothetical protein